MTRYHSEGATEYNGDMPPGGRLLGDLLLNDIVEITVRVNEELVEDGQILTVLTLLDDRGNFFHVHLYSNSTQVKIFAGDVLGRRTIPWVQYVPVRQAPHDKGRRKWTERLKHLQRTRCGVGSRS